METTRRKARDAVIGVTEHWVLGIVQPTQGDTPSEYFVISAKRDAPMHNRDTRRTTMRNAGRYIGHRKGDGLITYFFDGARLLREVVCVYRHLSQCSYLF